MKTRMSIGILGLLFLLWAPVCFAGGEIPEEVKRVVPVYADAKFREPMNLPNGKGVIMSSESDPKTVADFYKKAMVEKGWKLTTEKEAGENIKLVMTKDQDVFSFSSFKREPKGTTFILAVTKAGAPLPSPPPKAPPAPKK